MLPFKNLTYFFVFRPAYLTNMFDVGAALILNDDVVTGAMIDHGWGAAYDA